MQLSASILLFSSFCITANAVCNVDDHHPENGGYFIEGVNGWHLEKDPESKVNALKVDTTWAPGIEYPYGQDDYECIGAQCSCTPVHVMRDRCPKTISGHTCSVLRFCPGEMGISGSIYQMPDFEATEKCDFKKAKLLGQTFAGPPEACFDYVFEEDHELTTYYFADRQGCEGGQKVGITIEDFTMQAIRCELSGKTSDRIKNCDCKMDKGRTTTFTEPCRSAMVNACLANSPEDDSCCETESCIPRTLDFEDPIGEEEEMERRDTCDDAVPGLCYDEDGNHQGRGARTDGSKNCCEYTCSECGTELSPTATWKPCISSDYPDGDTAACGYLRSWDPPEDFYQCDFSKCDKRDHWHVEGDAYKKWVEDQRRALRKSDTAPVKNEMINEEILEE